MTRRARGGTWPRTSGPSSSVEAGSAADVAQAVRYARAHGIRIAPQGTGHGAGPLGPLDGAMLLRTTRMRQVRIDPVARTARAEAGAVWAGALLAGFPDAAIDALVGLAGPDTGTALASVEVVHLGGALARPASGGGAQPSIDADYLLIAVGVTPAPDLAAAVRAQAQAVKDALGPWRAGYDYYNSAETPAVASAVLPAASYSRLQQIKAARDPGQAIISAHLVQPTRP